MRILLAVASKHGSTREVGQVIADELRAMGHHVEIRSFSRMEPVADFDAVVLGSAVYLGDWLPEARRFVEQHHAELRTLPVWIFSSGPLRPDGTVLRNDIAGTTQLVAQIRPREHRTFCGSVSRFGLSRVERFAVARAGAADGDVRCWTEIRAWARDIGAQLVRSVPAATRMQQVGNPRSAEGATRE